MDVEKLEEESEKALSKAINWLAESFIKRTSREHFLCNDIPGWSFVLKSLSDVFTQKFDKLSPTLIGCRSPKLADSVNNYLGKIEEIKTPDEYLNSYCLLRDEAQKDTDYNAWRSANVSALLSYPKQFYSCLPCRTVQVIECLYMLKESLGLLDARFVMNGFMGKLLNYVERVSKEIDSLLREVDVDEKKLYGWSYTYQEEHKLDPFVSARVLDWIYSWKDSIDKLSMRDNLAPGKSIFQNCVNTIEELQTTDRKASRFVYGKKQDVSGGWEEIEFGRYSIYRIRAAADIGIILNRVGGSKRAIDKAKQFIDRSFEDSVSALDSTIFMDLHRSQISDITGTAGAVNFYLKTQDRETMLKDPTQLRRLEWLIHQRRVDGSWPVMSMELLGNPATRRWRRDPLKNAVQGQKFNISIPNTVIMIDALMSFLKP